MVTKERKMSGSNGPNSGGTTPSLHHSASVPSSSALLEKTPGGGVPHRSSTNSRFNKTTNNQDNSYTLQTGMVRPNRYLTQEEIANGRKPRWGELELTALWQLKHLTNLFLANNHLSKLPAEISQLSNLVMLDLSNNRLRSLPSELGDMNSLCHLYLKYNQIRLLPFELGKLFRLSTLALQGNPLPHDINKIYNEPGGTQKLVQFLLDHLAS